MSAVKTALAWMPSWRFTLLSGKFDSVCSPPGLNLQHYVVVQDKTNKLTRFHAFQSIFLAVASIPLVMVYFIGFGIAFAMTRFWVSRFHFYRWLIVVLLGLAIFVGIIISAVKGFQGQIFNFR